MIEHKTVSLADQVFERLESDILTGKYTRGEILTELRLSEDMGVSRTPIREALRRLEQEHLVESASKGIAVLGVSEDDLYDIYAIRIRLEGMAAARAAERANEETLADLREALDLQEYYVTRHDADRIKSQDSMFHEHLYRLSGSTTLFDTLYPLHKKVQKFRRASVQNEDRAEQSLNEHKRIFACLLARDAAGAEAAMTEHVKNAMNTILKRS
ncbi:MAG: GntR family transcriptional regulator [Clostridia bacterium]|nr:GntR family transcriptional regulator [Clostridia bacterium]